MYNLKYLYILTSNSSDIYYEQALLSVTSLKLKIPESFVSLLTDNKTKESLNERNRKELCKLIDEIITIDFHDDTENKYKSRWLKTSIRKHVIGDFLFLDCDTVIAEKLLIDKNVSLGAVQDIHLDLPKRFGNTSYREYHVKRDMKCGFKTSECNYFNSGVIFCRDTAECHNFFNIWHSLWLSGYDKGITEDQPSFSAANIACGNLISELDGTWNCQLVKSGIPYLPKAKIIHYYNAADNKKNYFFAKKNVFERIKEKGTIPAFYNKLFKHPRAAFYLINNKSMNFFMNKIFYLLLIVVFSKPLNYLLCFFIQKKPVISE